MLALLWSAPLYAQATAVVPPPGTPVSPVTIWPASAVNGAGVVTSPQILVPAGSAAAPSIALAGTPGFGFYFPSTTNVYCCKTGFGVGTYGTGAVFLSGAAGAGVVSVASGGTMAWSSSANEQGAQDTALSRSAAGVVAVGTGAQGSTAGTAALAGIELGTALAISGTAPTVTSGFGTATGAMVAGSTTLTFRITVGTGAATTVGVIGLPTTTTFWNCRLADQNNPLDVTNQTASSTSSASFTATIGWTAADTLIGSCTGS